MPRTIEISTDVFAAIWAARKDGEETENDILTRLFNVLPQSSFQVLGFAEKEDAVEVLGYFDSRNGVHFREGFHVFRHYKGSMYTAVATKGQWLRKDTGELFSSLNKLNESIAAGNENIWNGNWQYLEEDGLRYSIDKLRQ